MDSNLDAYDYIETYGLEKWNPLPETIQKEMLDKKWKE